MDKKDFDRPLSDSEISQRKDREDSNRSLSDLESNSSSYHVKILKIVYPGNWDVTYNSS